MEKESRLFNTCKELEAVTEKAASNAKLKDQVEFFTLGTIIIV